jgi:hypothetical protein
MAILERLHQDPGQEASILTSGQDCSGRSSGWNGPGLWQWPALPTRPNEAALTIPGDQLLQEGLIRLYYRKIVCGSTRPCQTPERILRRVCCTNRMS